MVLLQPTYFSPVIQYVAIAQLNNFIFEVNDNYQKQTYRNRCYVYTSQGKQLLNIPIQHNKGEKQKTKDVKIDYTENWQKLHLKTLQSSYSSSPFFEFYIDDLLPIFNQKHKYLLDLNLLCNHLILESLQLELNFKQTTSYFTHFDGLDLRHLAVDKQSKTYDLEQYFQVFSDKHRFISNLSILDLLFMEGPNALNYLENQIGDF
jgi:hypothetical protein